MLDNLTVGVVDPVAIRESRTAVIRMPLDTSIVLPQRSQADSRSPAIFEPRRRRRDFRR